MRPAETQWKNHGIQSPPPPTNGSYALDVLALQYAREGTPVTYKGETIGNVTSVTDDSVRIEIAKEHVARMREILNWSAPYVR